jgi:predicted peptidase
MQSMYHTRGILISLGPSQHFFVLIPYYNQIVDALTHTGMCHD